MHGSCQNPNIRGKVRKALTGRELGREIGQRAGGWLSIGRENYALIENSTKPASGFPAACRAGISPPAAAADPRKDSLVVVFFHPRYCAFLLHRCRRGGFDLCDRLRI